MFFAFEKLRSSARGGSRTRGLRKYTNNEKDAGAHFFAAGYDIRTPKGWDAAISEVVQMIGLKQVLAFHLNDSKTDLNSRVDRHDHIGHGLIGKKAFGHIVNDPRFADTPGCLETPKSPDLREDIANLTTLRSLLKKG